jgi:hypothetical protein
LLKKIQNRRARKCGCHPYATITPGAPTFTGASVMKSALARLLDLLI